MGDAAPLAGCSVWLTRPAGQNAPWAEAFSAAGATVDCEPLLAIDPPRDRGAALRALAAAASADIVIATSANAIAGARALAPAWQPQGRVLAVGAASAAAFSGYVGRAVERPTMSDSEGLLAHLAERDLAGCRVAILAGEGGRDALPDGLSARGAEVVRIALYRRRPVRLSAQRLDALLDRNALLVLTSDAAWQALMACCDIAQRRRLAALSLVASSRRVVQQTNHDIAWRYPPIVIDAMDTAGAQGALIRAWRARN